MKTMVRISALVLAILLVIPCLAGCNDSKRAVYTSGDAVITDDLYRYWLSYYKTYYAKYFYDIEDSEEGWAIEVSEGVTAEDYVKSMVDQRMKLYVCALDLYEDYKLELPDATINYINSTIEEQIDYYGGRAAFENALYRSCNITIDGLKKSYEIESKVSQLQEYLYGEKGIIKVSDDMLEEYFQANYSRIKYLYFDKVNKYVYDDKGEIKTDISGKYVTQALTDAEKAEVKSKAEEAFERAKGGAEFNSLITVYNTPDMNFAVSNPDGFYVSPNSYSSKYVYTIVYEGINMAAGEIKLVEDEYAYYVIAKYGLINNAYKTDETGQFEAIGSYAIQYYYENTLKDMYSGVVVDSVYVDSVGIMDLGESVNV